MFEICDPDQPAWAVRVALIKRTGEILWRVKS
jgi:hypothetical protein